MDIKTEVNKCLDQLSKEVRAFPWENKQAYANWLGQTYHYVCHSTRLLALAASRFENRKFNNRFLEHLREERGHEKLALHDLKALGVDIREINCFPETHAFYMTQYYYLEHTPPASFFGWILCLEGTAVRDGQYIYSKVKAAHGEKAGAFLKLHAEEDVSHLDKAYETLQGLDPAVVPSLVENLYVAAGLYGRFLRSCAEIKEVKKSAA